MFPMCHIYFANRVMKGSISDFAVLGSIYPDIAMSNILSRDVTHYNTGSLYKQFKLKDKSMQEFAEGAVTHGVDMMGLDYYSDESYKGLDKGYCFDRGKEIVKDVVACCNIPEEWGLWKAHNFTEMAFDLYLCRQNLWIVDSFNKAIENNHIIKYVSDSLQDYYDIPAEIFMESFKKFAGFVQCKGVDEYSTIEKYALQLNKKHGIRNINIEDGVIVLQKSLKIVSEDIDEFFDYTVSKVRNVLEANA